jgi:hypothetical protein
MSCDRCRILALFFILPLVVTAFAEESVVRIVPVGSYSSVRQDAEHCNGEALDVWRNGDSHLGLFHTCAGLTGDTITAVATVTEFDSPSHHVAFEGVLSRGMDYLKGGIQAPSKDHFTFTGTLAGDEVTGSLTWIDENYPTHKPRVVKLRMHRVVQPLPGFATQADWSQYAGKLSTQGIHQAR